MAELEECPICLQTLEKLDLVISDCNHKFHFNCLFKCANKQNSCPICRQKLLLDEEKVPRVYEGVFMVDYNTINVHGKVYKFAGSEGGTYSGIESYIDLINEFRANNPIVCNAPLVNRTYADVVAGSK